MSVSNLFGFSVPVEVSVQLTNVENRKQVDVTLARDVHEKLLLYFDREPVQGKVMVRVPHGKRLEHNGIRVECIGSISVFNDTSQSKDFLCLSQELAAPGELVQSTTLDFEFRNVEKQYETYYGTNVQLRYFVRAVVARRMASLVRECDILVHSYNKPANIPKSIKMEVGIEDCLHIEFEYNKAIYHLKDVIVGKIFFLLVRIKVKHMELCIVRRETTGSSHKAIHDNHTKAKFEIMDGAPVRGEVIPIRLFLGGYELTPTFQDVNKRFSVRYYLNLVLFDEENRRYYKQQEIMLYRRNDDDGIAEQDVPSS